MRNPNRIATYRDVITDDSFLDLCTPDVRWLHAFWEARCSHGVICPRRAVDPVDLPRHMLPMLNLVEAVDGGADYRYRLVGTGDVRERGRDPTGKLVSEAFYGSSRDGALASYDFVYVNRRPLFRHDRHHDDAKRYRRMERIFLPLSGDEDPAAVRYILVYIKSIIDPLMFAKRMDGRQAEASLTD